MGIVDYLVRFFVFSIYLSFFFSFGWCLYLISKLYGTREYGGRLYNLTLLKAAASSVFLYFAFAVGDFSGIPREDFGSGWMFLLSLFLLVGGWVLHWVRFRKKA